MSRLHTAAAAAVALIWGVNFVVIHVGLQTAPPLLLAALRFTLVAALLAPFVRRPALPWRRLLVLGLTLYVGQFALLFTAMDRGLSAGLAAVVLQSQAVFTFVGAVAVLGERPARVQVAGIGLAAAGLAALGIDCAGRLDLGGFLLALGGGASWAVGNLVARRSGTGQGLGLVVWGSVVAAPPLALLALLRAGGPRQVLHALGGIDGSGWAALGYLVVMATVVGFGTWSALLGRYPAATVAPFTMLVPPVGLLTAWLALGERPSGVALAGSAAVVAGLVWPQVVQRRTAARTVPATAAGQDDRAGQASVALQDNVAGQDGRAGQASGTISGAPTRTASAASSSNCS